MRISILGLWRSAGQRQGSRQSQRGRITTTRVLRIEPLEDRALLSAAPHTPAGWTAQPAFRADKLAAPDAGSASPSGLSPNDVRTWYGLGSYGSSGITGGITFGNVQGDGSGETIAIVDTFDDPSALGDLNAFSANYSLPQFNVSGGPTFQKLNQTGGTSLPSASGSSGWSIEESLDVDWAHAMAPKANIILFEASDAGNGLYTAVQTAAKTTGVVVVSMSWSGSEYSGENIDDTTYFTTPANHPGVTFLSATGDSGAYDSTLTTTVTPQYPAASPNVVAVGGTTIQVSGPQAGETVWGSGTSSGSSGGGGGGISAYESQPSWQTGLAGVSNYSTTQRVYPDVAADGNPYSGVPIYDSYDFGSSSPWAQYGGTSLACPMWAGMIAVADQGRAVAGRGSLDGPSQTLPMLYQMAAGDFRDVTTGGSLAENQSSTGPVPYNSTPGFTAAPGYDMTSGRGGPLANLVIPQLVGGTQLAFGQQPTATGAGSTISPAITVLVEDSLGNVVTSDNSNVTLSLGSNPSGGTLSGTLTVAAVHGVATFNNLSINDPGGGYTLIARDTISGSALTATSAAFTIGTPPGIAASAAAAPIFVTGNSTDLSVLGADTNGESTLTYTWTATTLPAGAAAPTFSANGTNAAKNTTVTFSAAGAYVLTATITDANDASSTSSVSVTVSQTATSMTVSPASLGIAAGTTQQFTATVFDQFGAAFISQPSVTWSTTTGSISASGLFTSSGASGTVTATDGSISGNAQIVTYQPPTVVNAAAASPGTVTGTTTNLTVLGADPGGEPSLTYTWTATTLPSGAAQPTYANNGTNAAKNTTATFSHAGTYVLQATITDANNWTVASSVTVVVSSTVLSLGISPSTITVSAHSESPLTNLFNVSGLDQFGNSINNSASLSWSASGGAVSSAGWYTPPSTGSSDTITVTSGGLHGSAAVNIAAPVGWWKFNEGSGTTANDSGSGTADKATVNSGNWVSAANGTDGTPALSFSGGSSSLINLGNPAKLSFTGQITLAAWVKLTSVNSTTVEYIIDHRTSVNNDIYLGIDDGQYEVGVQSSSTQFDGVDYTVPASDAGTWVHIVGTYDGTSWRLYRDGVLVASNADSQAAIAPSGNWGIGGAASGVTRNSPAYYFTGAIDDVRIYSTAISPAAVGGLMATPPTIATSASASPNPVAGTSTSLSVLGADDAGAASLTYTWSTMGTPPAAVSFSSNGTNASQNTTATFTQAGVYNIVATVTNDGNLTATSFVTVTVNQTFTSVVVQATPLAADGSMTFTAVGNDQFGNAMTSQPQFAWSVVGGGAISADGVFTPPYASGSATITATGTVSGNVTVTLPGAAQWNSPGNTSWNAADTWTSSSTNTAVPAPGTRTVAGDNAVFANGAGGTVTLDGASPNLAGLTFGDSGNYTIAQGSGGALHLANGSAAAAVTVTAGTQTITAPVVLDSNITISAAAGTLLNVTGPITANGHTITVTGPGKIVFSGPGSDGFSSTVVAAGKLVIQDPSMLADGSSLTVGDSSFFAAAPAVSAPVGVPALAGSSVVKSSPASAVPASTAPKPTTRSTSPPAVAYRGGPALPLWLRPHVQAAASVLAGQDASSSNGDKPAAIQALDAFFASFGR